MSTLYPASQQTFTNPLATDPLNNPSHSELHRNVQDTVEALQDRMGYGSDTTPGASGRVLYSSSSTATAWTTLASIISVPNFADNETPGGTINGSNTLFTLAQAPSPTTSLILVLNGQVQTQGVEYTLSGSTITFATAPDSAFSGLPFKAWYRYA